MKTNLTLAFETSAHVLSLALAEDDNILAEINLDEANKVSEKLALLVQTLFLENKITIKDLETIIFNNGPGSFTGLRVTLSFILGLSYPYHQKIITVNSLENLLWHNSNNLSLAICESKRDEVYYSYDGQCISKSLKKDIATLIKPDLLILTHHPKDFKNFISNEIQIVNLSASRLINIVKDKKIKQTIDPKIIYLS
jgi:tRNA threonylcarbamoyl adenosine modification protein YeaZ